MRKVSSTISHMGVIGLALLALVIGTVVWLFERLGTDDFGYPWGRNAELEAISLLEEEAETGVPLGSDQKAEGSATIL